MLAEIVSLADLGTSVAHEPEVHPMRQLIIKLRERFGALGSGLLLSKRGAAGRMTPSQARRIVVPKGDPITLDWVTDLPPAAARILARHDGQLRLPALRELSVETARTAPGSPDGFPADARVARQPGNGCGGAIDRAIPHGIVRGQGRRSVRGAPGNAAEE